MEIENPRIGNGEEDGVRRSDGDGGGGTLGRLYGWPASRIVRVSRASGGKDRHSKVLTSKGLRDRRVRLSVNTAVQFYDLQDRLGYDQPSKAVEWLLKAAAPFIDELPSLNAAYPDTLQLSDGRKPRGGGVRLHSSPSDNGKGSGGFSLSRPSEYPLLALDRTRAGKEKGKENLELMSSISQNSSFTELLTGGGGAIKGESEFFSVDYVTGGLLNQSSAHQIHIGNPLMNPRVSSSLFNAAGESQFSFVQHNNPNDYNLNFTISTSSSSSTGLAAFRGTLQSNSSSSSSSSLSMLPPHLQRFHPIEGTPTGFFEAAAPTAPPADNHHHFLHGLDARLQLYYGDTQADHKHKGKS